jgi:hypothetical protein
VSLEVSTAVSICCIVCRLAAFLKFFFDAVDYICQTQNKDSLKNVALRWPSEREIINASVKFVVLTAMVMKVLFS